MGFQAALVVKNWPANTGNVRDMGFDPGRKILGSGRSLGGRQGNLHSRIFVLENPMDRGSRATVHMGTKSQTQLKGLSTHTCTK